MSARKDFSITPKYQSLGNRKKVNTERQVLLRCKMFFKVKLFLKVQFFKIMLNVKHFILKCLGFPPPELLISEKQFTSQWFTLIYNVMLYFTGELPTG